MLQPLLELFEQRRDGGCLPPILRWASGQVAERFDMRSPVALLQQAVASSSSFSSASSLSSSGNSSESSSSLDSVMQLWMQQRVQQHVPYFCVCAVVVVLWLLLCISLCISTCLKEHRRSRRRGTDEVDGAVNSERSGYSSFKKYVSKKLARSLASENNSKPGQQSQSRNGLGDVPDSFLPRINVTGSLPLSWSLKRVIDADSKRAITSRSRTVRCLTAFSVTFVIVCCALMIASLILSPSLVSLTSSASDGSGHDSIHAMTTAVVGHIDEFLNRSLVESNATIIRIFTESQPEIQRLFLDFGQQLLDSLMADYNITTLINELQSFLQHVNSTVNAMQLVAASRDSTIRPLNAMASSLDEKQQTLQSRLSALCRRVTHPACAPALQLTPRLKSDINDTLLDTDTSVTVVTLINKMLKLDISSVQKQIESAQSSLGDSLNAISDVVRTLLDDLVGVVSQQFQQAEDIVAEVKLRYEAAAASPQLWSAVQSVSNGLLALLLIAGLTLAASSIIGCCLLASMCRFLRINQRLNRSLTLQGHDSNNNDRNCFQLNGQTGDDRMLSGTGGLNKQRNGQNMHDSSSLSSRRCREKVEKLAARETNGFAFCCSTYCSLLLLALAAVSVLPMLLSMASFYASAELHVEACRYLTDSRGLSEWDSHLDRFLLQNVWPKVRLALRSQDAIPIELPKLPSQLLHAVAVKCRSPNRTLFEIFDLQNALNSTAILRSNSTQRQFEFGANLIKKKINETDMNSLIPSELEALKPVLVQIGSVMDEQDYADSIRELRKPLLALNTMELNRLKSLVKSVLQHALDLNSSDRDAIILEHTLEQVNETLLKAPAITSQLQQLLDKFQQLQNSRIVSQLTSKVLAALSAVQIVIQDKRLMLDQVNHRYYSILNQRIPTFAQFLDPLAVSIFQQVGHCDDIARAFSVIADSFCNSAVSRIADASLLLCVTILMFGCFYCCYWLLLLHIRRHQLAAHQLKACRMRVAIDGGDRAGNGVKLRETEV